MRTLENLINHTSGRKKKVMLKFLKKTLAVCMIGFGLGVLLVLLLPITGWLFIIGVLVVIVGLIWLSC